MSTNKIRRVTAGKFSVCTHPYLLTFIYNHPHQSLALCWPFAVFCGAASGTETPAETKQDNTKPPDSAHVENECPLCGLFRDSPFAICPCGWWFGVLGWTPKVLPSVPMRTWDLTCQFQSSFLQLELGCCCYELKGHK